jgi:hypothetical protein
MPNLKSTAKDLIETYAGPRLMTRLRALYHQPPLLSGLAAKVFPRRFSSWHRRRTFGAVYGRGLWGTESGSPFFSGVGSRGDATDDYVARMAALIEDLEAGLGRPVTIVDLGCGDFAVGRRLLERLPRATYIGCDIVPKLVQHHAATVADPRASFRVVDIVSDPLPEGDVCLVRQVLQHLGNADIVSFLPKLGAYRSAYVTEGYPVRVEGPVNPDKPAGSGVRYDWRTGRGRGVELDRAPFDRPVEEVLRTQSTPFEQVVTYRLTP